MKKKTPPPRSSEKKPPARSHPVQGLSLKERLDRFLGSHRLWVLAVLVVISVFFRWIYFGEMKKTHLMNQHRHSESDMFVFDEWAQRLAAGDWLSRTYKQPEHQWMKWIADRYFENNPEKLAEYTRIAGPDTTVNTPVKALWEHWYGKRVFPHEPLYAYFLAINYRIFGHDTAWVFRWQLLLGVLSIVLIWLITRRWFGDLAAAFAAFSGVFFGPMLFFEMVLLRSSLGVFFSLLTAWLLGEALVRKQSFWWISGGIATGGFIMLHGYILLFVILWVGFLVVRFWGQSRQLILSAGGFLAGLLIALSPIAARNAIVGAPVFSMSNNSAVGFITMNDKPFKPYLGWNLDVGITAEIMGKSDGKLLRAIIPTIQTHDRFTDYLKQLASKLQAAFSWYEIQNNVNFYFYREQLPVLHWTFLGFFFLSPLAIAGIFLSLFRSNRPWPLYLLVVVFLAAMLGFMVLSRYRIVFAGILLPFAGYALSCLFDRWKGWRNAVLLASLALLGYFCYQPPAGQVGRVVKNDYLIFWTIHYYPELSTSYRTHDYTRSATLFLEFLERYEPGYIRNMPSYYHCKTKDEAEIFSFFADVRNNFAGLYQFLGLTSSAEKQKELAARYRNAAGE